MSVWSKAMPLTARYLSPPHVFETRPRHVRKLSVTWSYAVVFAGNSGSLHYLQLASHELVTVWHKCDEKRNSKFRSFFLLVTSQCNYCPAIDVPLIM